MSFLAKPFNPTDPSELIEAVRRSEDDLPDHVKGTVTWRDDRDHPAGYYILSDRPSRPSIPVEFFENHWYKLFPFKDWLYVSYKDQIPHFERGTGYWKPTDPEYQADPPRLFVETEDLGGPSLK